MTNKEFYTAVIEANVSDEITATAQRLLNNMEYQRQYAIRKKATENAPIRKAITKCLVTAEKGMTISELREALDFSYSTSKISAVARSMVNSGKLVSEDKIIKSRVVKSYKVNPDYQS